MFKPTFGTCKGNLKHPGCRNEGIIMTSSRGLCQACESKRKPKKQIAKTSKKQVKQIKENKEFYQLFIERHPTKCCDECKDPIHNPTGSNVSHIISSGNNKTLYHDLENAFLLCQTCENQWTRISPKSMKIWPEAQRRKVKLLNKYYLKEI